MSCDPRRVALQAALRTEQLQGTNQAALQVAYASGYTALDGADVPVGGLVDAVLAVEAELTEIIANDRNHPYRQLFYGRSDDLVTTSAIPFDSDEMLRFVGVFSGVNDSENDTPLTEGTIQEIVRFLRGNYHGIVRKYAIVGDRIHHTVDNVYLEGCVFSPSIARQRFSAPFHLSPIPASLESTWVARTIEFLASEGWLITEGEYYGNFAASGIARLKSRSLDLPQLPKTESTSNPVTD